MDDLWGNLDSIVPQLTSIRSQALSESNTRDLVTSLGLVWGPGEFVHFLSRYVSLTGQGSQQKTCSPWPGTCLSTLTRLEDSLMSLSFQDLLLP